jgi:UDP-2,3-diacylglucosamine pyrophosphatase LpxH
MSFRTIWLSDVHLGSRACRVKLLLDFLRNNHCDQLYLVGDIIDIESLKRSFFWPASHTEVLQLILQKSQNGTRVVYIPGNHDDDLRSLVGLTFGNIEIMQNAVHTTRSGLKLLVMHGDEFDSVIKSGPFKTAIGGMACRMLLRLNRLVHWIHDLFGLPYWSLAQHVKMRVGKAVRYVDTFRHACVSAAREAGMDGVICGHIHRADLRQCEDILYCNDGDWVESCTAIVEDQHGDLSLVRPSISAAPEVRNLPLRDAA